MPARLWLGGLAAVMVTAASLSAQEPADRGRLAAFRDTLATLAASHVADSLLPVLRADQRTDLSRLRLGFALVAAEAGSASTTRRAEALDLFARVLRSNPDWPDAWYGLGLARAALASSGAVAREGLLQPAGAGFAVGAAHALIRAVTLDSTFDAAAATLASHPAFDGWEIDAPQVMAAERLAALRNMRTAGSPPADVWLGRAVLESEAGSLDTAAVYLVKYLGAGGDPGVGWYRLARVRYRLADETGAIGAYYAGAESSASERASELYRWNIAWVADSTELAAYDSLPAAERADWLRRFWGERDAYAGREEGERLLEHFRRYEYALEHFALRPSLVDRRAGKARATVGSSGPAAAAGADGDVAGGVVAEDGESSGQPLNNDPLGARRRGGVAGGAGKLSSQWDTEAASWLAGASSFFTRFVTSQQLLDHRGLVYLRHGPPDQRAFAVGVGANETWKYNVPPEPMIFHFAEPPLESASSGSAGPTILVAWPGKLDAMCGLDTELCLLGMSLVRTTAMSGKQQRIGSATAGPVTRPVRVTEARRQVERAEEWIARGTTTDTYAPRFEEPIEPVVQLYAVYGAPRVRHGRVLAVFAIEGDQLLSRPAADSSGRVEYPLAIRVIAFSRDGQRHELDTVRTFLARRRLESGEYLMGQLELPLPPGDYTMRVLIEEQDPAGDDGRGEPGSRPAVEAERGALVGLDGVRVPARGTGLELSDIVLGRTGSGLTWWSGRERVPLNPLNAVPRGGTVQLYYEVSGLTPGAAYRTRLAVYRRGDDRRRALLTLTFAETASAEWQSIVRALDIGRLAQGSYDLEVRVQRADGRGDSVDRRAVLNVRGR